MFCSFNTDWLTRNDQHRCQKDSWLPASSSAPLSFTVSFLAAGSQSVILQYKDQEQPSGATHMLTNLIVCYTDDFSSMLITFLLYKNGWIRQFKLNCWKRVSQSVLLFVYFAILILIFGVNASKMLSLLRYTMMRKKLLSVKIWNQKRCQRMVSTFSSQILPVSRADGSQV